MRNNKEDLNETEDIEINFSVDEKNRVIIDFSNLETLLYFVATSVLENVKSDKLKDLFLSLLGAYAYELLDYLFPEELADYCDRTSDSTMYS